jgi:hypothetical protein
MMGTVGKLDGTSDCGKTGLIDKRVGTTDGTSDSEKIWVLNGCIDGVYDGIFDGDIVGSKDFVVVGR